MTTTTREQELQQRLDHLRLRWRGRMRMAQTGDADQRAQCLAQAREIEAQAAAVRAELESADAGQADNHAPVQQEQEQEPTGGTSPVPPVEQEPVGDSAQQALRQAAAKIRATCLCGHPSGNAYCHQHDRWQGTGEAEDQYHQNERN